MNFLSDLELNGKRVLYRVDINSNISEGKILDDTRIRAIVPSIELMLEKGVKRIVFLAHQGRGKERSDDKLLDLHAQRLSELLGQEVLKLDASRGVDIPEDARLVMLENVRLDDEESKDEQLRAAFAKDLMEYGDVYVNDAFAACHRAHTTICTLPRMMDQKAAGLLLEKEIKALRPLLDGEVEKPFTVIVAGAKIDTKIGVINQFIDSADHFLLGGGIANTFLAAEGFDVGESLYEEDQMELARTLAMKLDVDSVDEDSRLRVPEDVICADEIGPDVATVDIPTEDVIGDMKILDIGAKTAANYAEIIKNSKTVIWNGPVGLAEYAIFRKGSESIAKAMIASDATTIVGGGESVGVINALGLDHDQFTHISTGGGAMLEYLGGKELPGIHALEE